MGACYCYYSRSLPLMMEIFLACTQDYRRDGPDDDRVAGEPTEGRYDGDCDQRANYFECLSDGEGEDAAENWAILAGSYMFSVFFPPHYSRIHFFLCTAGNSLAVSVELKASAWRRLDGGNYDVEVSIRGEWTRGPR
jgi:hypothetical protein